MQFLRMAVLIGLALVATSFTPSASCADSWMMPTTRTFTSCKGHARVTVTPRDLESQLAYFGDKVDHVEPAGQTENGPRAATARVQTRTGGRWRTLWEKPIANEVAPVDVIVREDGAYTVTFDNWHGTGYGPNAVVIYGPSGEQVRALALTDLVPQDYIDALPHSVSSIRWRGTPCFSSDGRRVVIPVLVPTSDDEGPDSMAPITVDLATGAVAPANDFALEQALSAGRRVHAEQLAAAARAKAAFLAPLLGPAVNDQEGWHDYLREAVARLRGPDISTSTTVLRLPGAKDYAITETWTREALTKSYADNVALASLSPANMVAVLHRIGASLPPRSLSKVTLYVAARGDIWPEIRAAMAPTGVHLVQLDPDRPIPQRRDRIAQRYGA